MQNSDAVKEPLLGRDFLLICASNFLAFFSLYLIIPVLPLFLEERGHSNALIGALMSVAVVAALLRPALGRAGDRRGRKAIFAGGILLLAFSNLLYAAFTSVAALFWVRLLNGCGLAAYHTSAYAMVGDLVPRARRLEGIGILYISFDSAIALAPPVAEVLKNHLGFNAVYLMAGIVAFLSFALALAVRERREPHPLPRRGLRQRAWPQPLQVAIYTLTAGYTLTLGALSTFIVLSAAENGINQGELFFTVFAVTLIAFRLSAGKRLEGLPRRTLIMLAGCTALIGLAIIAVSRNLVVFILGSMVYALGFAYIPTALSALLLDHTPEERRGSVLGIFTAAFDLGIGAGSLAMGPVADAWGYPAMYAVSGIVALASTVYFFAAIRGGAIPARPPAEAEAALSATVRLEEEL